MPAETYALSTSEIFWEHEETRVTSSSVDFISISCQGRMMEENNTLANALLSIPSTLPISADGPVRLSSEFAGAGYDERTAVFGGDGTIIVNVTYKFPNSEVSFPPDDDGSEIEEFSPSDRFDKRVETESAPLLTHPVARAFPIVEKNKLKNLLEGDVIPNPDYAPGGGDGESEFIYAAPIGSNSENAECAFDDSQVTEDGVTASPLDYARLIKGGVDTYDRRTTRFLWQCTRATGVSNNEINRVGDISKSSVLPSAQDGRDWFFSGVTDSHEADGAHLISREFVLSERGGALKEIYKGGSGSISS